jgi:glycosyltransferase involved in cell wall biosynthesis
MIIGVASADYLRADRSPDGVEKWGGAGWARLGQYIPYFREAGHEVYVGTLWQRDGKLAVEQADGSMEFPDVILLQRIMHDKVDQSIKFGQEHGQVVINDLDDWYWGLDPSNEAFKASHPKYNQIENTLFYAKNMQASDLITTSTPYLAQRLKEKFKRDPIILPNCIDVGRFSPVDQDVDVPTVGWAGSTSHRSGDIETVRGVFERFLRDGQIKMYHGGDAVTSPSFASVIGLDDELVERSPRRTTEEYPQLLTMQIGMVPLRDTPFNMAKSAIKGLEYAASGIPFIAAALPSYREIHDLWGGGFMLAKRPMDWVKATKKLLDKSLRIELQQSLLESAKQHDIQHGAKAWLDLLEGLA